MSTPFPLGRVAEFDERSRNYAHPPRSLAGSMGRPQHRSHHVFGKRLDQGQVGMCTGAAITGARNTLPNHKGSEVLFGIATAAKVYARATELDDVPGSWKPDGTGEDTGSSGLAACKAAVELGLFDKYEWCFGLDHALDALRAHPVCVGTNWYEDMFNPDSHGLVRVGGAIAGGHEWEIYGYDLVKGLAFGVNSWGPTWGINGTFIIPLTDVDRLLKEDGDVVVPLR